MGNARLLDLRSAGTITDAEVDRAHWMRSPPGRNDHVAPTAQRDAADIDGGS
jgi:hypothetical protein